ncbi:MAG: relaxase domain-containing protein [Phycisphaerae bacterium]|nr:relaxase domain-containing protein [Phycisphaerae bacterium]MCZ2400080.1 relaxase domain-containing protein [Phycisphaerae bacterium]
MLRITQNNSPDRAKSYYSTSDYYSEGQELVGVWKGKGAARLGLTGNVGRADWDALCENRHPVTGETLTPRTKRERRVGYDFNFHVPKSVSILYGLTRDERILDAFRESVEATMEDIEAEMQTRVRAGGRNEDRTTGNMVIGEFVHFTARPVEGVPDPHLHAHCFVFNTTWDDHESRWKAGQFASLKRDAPFFEAVFHARLARRLEELGLPTQRTKQGWELAGVPQSAIEKFSRRTALIEEAAREKGVTDPQAKGELGAKTREKKQKDLTLDELRREWKSRMTADELAAFEGVKGRLGMESLPEDGRAAREAALHAVGHCFERSAVVPERKILAEAMKRAVGKASPESVARNLSAEHLVVAERKGRRLATTRSVLEEETRMLAFARGGRGTCRPLGASGYALKRDWLNSDQQRAVRHVLDSNDRVILVRGAAGTGKTTMMKEAVEGIQAGGKRVFVFAPSADASRGVLGEVEGFANADTVARLLVDERLQAEIAGQVIWIDEAGLLGSRMMGRVFDLADRLGARVILSGDRRQHGSVERGAALRLLEEEAGLVPAEIREIQRQRADYKEAVRALSEGRTEDGFRELNRLGWIREVGETERYKALAEDYVTTVEAGKSALVVSPTHLEGEWITDEIRARLKQAGRLGEGERTFQALESANLTEAEKADPLNYSPGDVLVYHQNAKGHRKGERVVVNDEPLPLDQAERFQVYRPSVLPIAPGDVLRITRNGTTADGRHRLNNGALYAVRGFDASGNIVLANGWTVSKDYGHLAHGYVVTSHASQGKTVDRVFIGQSSDSLPASSREQFYVSVSRGREQATIYTDDKEALLEAVSRSDDRLTATEFVAGRDLRERAATLQRLERLAATYDAARAKHFEQERMIHER